MMRISAQSHLAINPPRNDAAVQARRGIASPFGPTKPVRSVSTTGASANPFASLFQNLSQTVNASSTSTATPAATPAATPVAAPAVAAAAPVQAPGIGALVSAIMTGTLKTSYVTDPAQLKETNPAGTAYMPNFYYASDDTANQLAQLLGGKVVKMTPFGNAPGFNEPAANFIQLPNGQTVNAADLAYYGRCGVQGAPQLTADLTQTVNQGSAWCNYYHNGGQPPDFALGYVGPPISGMNYPAGTIGSDGMVINPAMQGVKANT
jgi:hypothetical protein